MTIIERKSKIRVQALLKLVEKGEYSVEYALVKLDELNEKGYLTGKDYEESFDKLAEMLTKSEIVEEPEEVVEEPEENVETEEPEPTENIENTETSETEEVEEE